MDEDALAPADPSGSGAQSIGAYLASQRRLRGVSIEELSQQTRIPLRSLQRLEAGSFDANVDGFVRGFVRTVAEALGLDADETLNRTLPEPGEKGRRRATPRLSLQRILVTVLAVALVGAVGFGVQLIAVEVAGEASRNPQTTVTVRRDPVRALAEAQGVAAVSPTPALALASAQWRDEARQAESANDAELVLPAATIANPVSR